MFTDEDTKLIRRLYLWPKLGTYFLFAIFPTLAAWVILIMIDDIALESRGVYEAGIFALIPIVLIYLVVSMVLLVRSRSLAGSYYDDLIVRFETEDGLHSTVSYETDPEDEYDEYSSSYVYLTFEAL